MKTILTTSLLLLFFTLSAQVEVNNGWMGRKGERVRGNGDVTTQTRNIDGFTGVSACCSMNVELAEGPFNIRVEAESNLQEFVKTEVKGDRLEVGYVSEANFKSTEPINVYITLPRLEYLKASSSSTVTGTNTFHGDELEVDVSSSATATLAFVGQSVSTDASSSATLVLEGEAEEFEGDASSSSRIDAGKLKTQSGEADVSSSADIIVNVARSLRAKATSSGSVSYYGSPSDVSSDTNSSGSVRSRN
ncbi:hypothetical protein LEM8419_02697 [Neolewinella maritima]|uniref:Putative auto-transporter adhesin head GIN domain-containing protein n=1 Tax=Neolewinella maritima TaxID=1383882 RepID=A0ABM9B4G1_9BACT|nr:head GIN domain-containing protein [Neolewinella maritima]CAH1001790.1 hypothetical protein LEM8419_02697 [Neolewinella maritima]